MHIVVTGCAGFIGFHVCKRLLDEGYTVSGIDNLNDYYSVQLKKARLTQLEEKPNFSFYYADIGNPDAIKGMHLKGVTHIIHLAAQAGVRYSIENPYVYGHSNLMGHLCMLEFARAQGSLEHMVYASTSSVYGANDTLPFSLDQRTDTPVSLYSATKKACEVMSESYQRMYGIPFTGLRYFTVYGPWGRPDMALFKFTKAMLASEEIPVFNHGRMRRNFTYIDDVVDGTLKALWQKPAGGHQIYNIGNSSSEELMDYIRALETSLNIEAKIKMEPMQLGDIEATEADISVTRRELGFVPKTDITDGVRQFVNWYRSYYG